MIFEKSCGGVIFIKENGKRKYLILKHCAGGHWSFPKGHIEKGETEEETALREIFEETGLYIILFNDFRYSMQYSPKEGVLKNVIYFIGETISTSVRCQIEEIEDFKWLDFDEAYELLMYENDKNLLNEVELFLNKV